MSKPAPQKRHYRQNRRAEQTSLTRQRIVEAAIDLHRAHGPAQTTISMVAEQAGVQRHTFYAHFPTELSLLLACSGVTQERDPLPDAATLRAIEDPAERLKGGLGALYDWYGRNAKLVASVLRDAEHHALTREVVALRITPALAALTETLSAGIGDNQRPLLHLALSFFTWRSLALEGGLSNAAAVETMARAIFASASQHEGAQA